MKFTLLVTCAVALTLGCSAAPGGSSDKALGLHSDGAGWGFRPADKLDAGLPRVLLVGDSVMNSYRADVARQLAGQANVDTWATGMHLGEEHLLDDLAKVLAQGPYTVVHFNIGLHDWPEGRIPPGQYEPLMQRYVASYISNAPAAKLIWASSTPVTVKGGKTLDPKINPAILRQNEIAARVMQEHGIPIDDLYSLGAGHLALARGDQFHWTPEGTRLMVGQVARSITVALGVKDRTAPVASASRRVTPTTGSGLARSPAFWAIAFQEAVDFSLRMPGNAALFVLLLVLASRRSKSIQ